MGGLGSGGWNRRNRGTVEGHRWIDIGQLQRAGVLGGGQHVFEWKREGQVVAYLCLQGGRDRIRLQYQVRVGGEDWHAIDEPVIIRWRACPFGGERPFFSCPHCARLAMRLHLAGARFRCRRCSGLSYASQCEDERDRSLRRANRLRARLGGEPGLGAVLPRRPKHMHERTYKRMIDEIWDREIAVEDYAAQMLMRLSGRLERKPGRSFWA